MDRGEGACAEVDSDTEAVAGRGFKLGCISCKKRSEVQASATVEWFFSPTGESDFKPVSSVLTQPIKAIKKRKVMQRDIYR